jgi:putative chitinase|tara:strand:+ start:466 stop:1347 length:882 start_codon:yes stop_codon:yes gene_type:complete
MFWSKKNKMDKILTKDMLAAMIPGNDKVDMWFEAIEEIFPKYEINTVERIAGFIAQCAHESNNFRSLEENLNYSEDALLRVFGRYFGKAPKASASEYARNPEMIANRVYNDEFRKYKMGNTQPGDGWMFRGRGLKQLTGRENYTKFGKSVKMSAEQAAEYVATEKGAIESACWFWNNKKLNAIADTGNIKKLTKVINGGDIGLADRTSRYDSAIEILGGKSVSKKSKSSKVEYVTVSVGDNNDTVKALQAKLGLTDDGIFGPGTKRAVRDFQAKHGLTADGIAGPATLKKLLG